MNQPEEKQTVSNHVEPVAIKPCPFCGGDGVVTIRPRGFRVECENRKSKCPVNMRTHHKSNAKQVKELWNERPL
jgi:hypothetical protein